MKLKSIVSLLFMVIGLVCIIPNDTNAQTSIKKQRKQFKQKTLKDARKEAKKYEKDGYYVPPGKLPMARQLDNSYLKLNEMEDNGYQKYITGEASAVGQTKIAAKNQAIEVAKLELAGKIETTVAALIESSIANNQLDQQEAASLTKTVTAAKNIISQKIGRTIVLFEAYKDVNTRNVESSVIVAYNHAAAIEMAKQTIREELEEEANDLHEKLDEILDF